MLPTLQSLIYLPVPTSETASKSAMIIIDPRTKWPPPQQVMAALAELGATAGEVIIPSGMRNLRSSFQELAETPGPKSPDGEIQTAAATFLFETLQRKHRFRSRGGMPFLTTASWRTPIKKYQIQALKQLKADPPAAFVEAVAKEMCKAANLMVGLSNVTCVTNIPCGHSQGRCLSELLARALAREISAPYLSTFKRQIRKGSSHPRTNGGLEPFVVENVPKGTVLLVDDVVSSGRHFEMAIQKLAPLVGHVAGIAWIGDG
ncbi:MAG: phosphoribosyltransferase [Proteobacteria bacterium]|nr:phosphoribosyltransferase [Pseudomonadota bacterium]